MRHRCIRAGATLAMVTCLAASALGQTPPLALSVGPPESGWPVHVQIGAVLDDAGLRDALDSALPLRFHLRVELWRKATFDRLVAAEEIAVAILQDPLGGGYSVETGSRAHQAATIGDAQRLLAELMNPNLRPGRVGRHYYLATLVVETLSLSDLDELRRWLRGEVVPAIEGRGTGTRAVERGLRRLMVRVIGLPSRRFEARTGTFETR
jgi:hypothetical protein